MVNIHHRFDPSVNYFSSLQLCFISLFKTLYWPRMIVYKNLVLVSLHYISLKTYGSPNQGQHQAPQKQHYMTGQKIRQPSVRSLQYYRNLASLFNGQHTKQSTKNSAMRFSNDQCTLGLKRVWPGLKTGTTWMLKAGFIIKQQ